jgi:hypothetical protein
MQRQARILDEMVRSRSPLTPQNRAAYFAAQRRGLLPYAVPGVVASENRP